MTGSGLSLARLALVGALLGALCVAGCGRKTGLDAPPGAQLAEPVPPAADPNAPPAMPDGRPLASQQGPRKRTFLDWLID